jgi:hypothetical protein
LDPYVICDTETKEQFKEWRHSGSPYPKNFKAQKLSNKVLASVFWDKDGILLVDYMEKGTAKRAKYYVALPNKPKQQLLSENQGKLSKGILFPEDNAGPRRVAITNQKLADLCFEVFT